MPSCFYKGATYLEVNEDAPYCHGAVPRTINIWGPKLRVWLENVRGNSR